jgi:hypothetical protein
VNSPSILRADTEKCPNIPTQSGQGYRAARGEAACRVAILEE